MAILATDIGRETKTTENRSPEIGKSAELVSTPALTLTSDGFVMHTTVNTARAIKAAKLFLMKPKLAWAIHLKLAQKTLHHPSLYLKQTEMTSSIVSMASLPQFQRKMPFGAQGMSINP